VVVTAWVWPPLHKLVWQQVVVIAEPIIVTVPAVQDEEHPVIAPTAAELENFKIEKYFRIQNIK
jgi:hypothetical protein